MLYLVLLPIWNYNMLYLFTIDVILKPSKDVLAL